jgi:tetratricopeptide (TPR) repeat protein
MGVHLERALILFEQSRFDLAEQEVRRDLEAEPDNATAHALLGLCLSERGEHRQAMWAAQEAVNQEPDLPFAHYALASIMQDRERLNEAKQAIEEAIRLDPKNTNYLAQLASIRFDQGRWQEALEVSEQGLRLDAEHVACANFRAMALNKLGRASEARAAIASALRKDPSNAVTHANQGWACLQKGDAAQALEHFREALRLDAEFAMARHGIVECLKTRYLIYRLLLRFMLWMAGLSKRAQWGLILGGAAGYLGLLFVKDEWPTLAPLIWPLLIIYLLFGVLAWIADPLFNLLLRLDRFGRLALTPSQLKASNWVGLSLLGVVVWVAIGLFTGYQEALLGAAVFGLLVIPLTGIFDCQTGWPRRTMAAYTAVLAVLGLVGSSFLLAMRILELEEDVEHGYKLAGLYIMGAFVLGSFLSGWVAIVLIMVRSKR